MGALERPKRAFVACGFALAGALAGGALKFAWAGANPESACTVLDALPGIRRDMIAAVRASIGASSRHDMVAGFSWSSCSVQPGRSVQLGWVERRKT